MYVRLLQLLYHGPVSAAVQQHVTALHLQVCMTAGIALEPGPCYMLSAQVKQCACQNDIHMHVIGHDTLQQAPRVQAKTGHNANFMLEVLCR